MFSVNGSTPGMPRLPPTRWTCMTDAKSVWFSCLLVCLWCHAGIHVSVAVVQTLSCPWRMAALYAEPHNGAWLCGDVGSILTGRVHIRRTN